MLHSQLASLTFQRMCLDVHTPTGFSCGCRGRLEKVSIFHVPLAKPSDRRLDRHTSMRSGLVTLATVLAFISSTAVAQSSIDGHREGVMVREGEGSQLTVHLHVLCEEGNLV